MGVGEVGLTTPAMKNFQIIHFEIASEAVSSNKYHSSDLPVCSFPLRTKLAIAQLIARLMFGVPNSALLSAPLSEGASTTVNSVVTPARTRTGCP